MRKTLIVLMVFSLVLTGCSSNKKEVVRKPTKTELKSDSKKELEKKKELDEKEQEEKEVDKVEEEKRIKRLEEANHIDFIYENVSNNKLTIKYKVYILSIDDKQLDLNSNVSGEVYLSRNPNTAIEANYTNIGQEFGPIEVAPGETIKNTYYIFSEDEDKDENMIFNGGLNIEVLDESGDWEYEYGLETMEREDNQYTYYPAQPQHFLLISVDPYGSFAGPVGAAEVGLEEGLPTKEDE